MSPIVPRRSAGRPSLLSGPPILFALVALVVVGLAVGWALGLVDLSGSESTEPSTAGLVPVPTVGVQVPAYSRLTRDHIWDLRNRRQAIVYLPPAAVTPEMLLKVSDIIGRVLAHDKSPGYVFTEADFLPRGTREGLVAGIPAGKRAVRISADRVEGLVGLHMGDRFDLLATMPIDASRGGGNRSFNVAGAYGQQLALEAQLSNWQKQATVRVMVQNGVIIEPLATRGVPMLQSSLAEGGVTRTRPVQEAVIAINPDEVARLTEALAVEAKITAVPRSGRPDDDRESLTPELRPVSPFSDPRVTGSSGADLPDEASFHMVETIMGQKRELTAVPKR
ncbi:MAG: hypothetical protein ACT4QD_24460 [Acidobacteriota bacterium]